jgi:hypothetical protein
VEIIMEWITGRIYSLEEYRVYFLDKNGREFHRVVRERDQVAAIHRAATEDREAGGGVIEFLKIES